MRLERLKVVSVGFSILAFATFSIAGITREDSLSLSREFTNPDQSWRWYVILGAGFILLRLLCDLISERKKVENKNGSGEVSVYGEVAQRFADSFIIMGCALVAIGPYRLDLGWFCTLTVLGAAYVKVLGVAASEKQRIVSPLRKHFAMAALFVGGVALGIFPGAIRSHNVMDAVLFVVSVGSIYASSDELRAIARDLRKVKEGQT